MCLKITDCNHLPRRLLARNLATFVYFGSYKAIYFWHYFKISWELLFLYFPNESDSCGFSMSMLFGGRGERLRMGLAVLWIGD